MIMKKVFSCTQLTFAALGSIFLSGCLPRTATVSPRHFVLAPMPADESSKVPKSHLSVEIGFVKMPAYLLRDSIAVRTGSNEIQYLEDALWAERLDRSFQRTLVANLSHSFPSAEIQPADFQRRGHALDETASPNPPPVESQGGPKMVRIQVHVEQFDVDTRGHGQLIANWRIISPDSNVLLKSGSTSVTRAETLARGDPQAVAWNMSLLTAEFSDELARSLSGVVNVEAISRSK
jgi:uncharacterized lipoprotein YmbA